MSWTIEYAETAKDQLSRLDRQTAQRVLEYMDVRVARLENPRELGRALSGPMGGLWRYRVGDCRVVCAIEQSSLRVLVVRVGRRDRVYR
ncbi:MAG: type II toxin-antitoxin system RelE/ParE family toxin [Gammaproteobacteria bacterium]|nr:type II toxin-antitoxin system RelE/ParE family toxin [Gammaproteobacteria bacterium]